MWRTGPLLLLPLLAALPARADDPKPIQLLPWSGATLNVTPGGPQLEVALQQHLRRFMIDLHVSTGTRSPGGVPFVAGTLKVEYGSAWQALFSAIERDAIASEQSRKRVIEHQCRRVLGVPESQGFSLFSGGLEFSARYGQVSALSGDVTGPEKKFNDYRLSVGAIARAKVLDGLVVTLRTGAEAAAQLNMVPVQRCERYTEPDSAVEVRSCRDTTLLMSAPGVTSNLYLRNGITLVDITSTLYGYHPGIETSFNLEQMATPDGNFEFRLSLFLAQASNTLNVRTGVGFSLIVPLADGNLKFAPFGFVLANFDFLPLP